MTSVIESFRDFERAFPPLLGAPGIHQYLRDVIAAGAVGRVAGFRVTVTAAALATAGEVALFTPAADESWVLQDLKMLGPLTNFHSGGDRLLTIKSSTNVFSVVPNTNLETAVQAAWGVSTPLPLPATAAHAAGLITAAAPLIALYSGGTTDHDSGSLVLAGTLLRTI